MMAAVSVADPAARARVHAYEGARPELRALVPPDARRVLDLGCASGALGATLAAEVVGVERDPDRARTARTRLAAVVEAELETLDLAALGTFDCVVAGDVLEHLVDPWAVLARAAATLRPGGAAVVSLPNVRYWETFWALGARGTWPRRREGIFDATHLRWFTLADAHALVRGAGLEVTAVRRRLRLRPTGPPLHGTAARVVGALPGRTLVTFQHVLAARRRA